MTRWTVPPRDHADIARDPVRLASQWIIEAHAAGDQDLLDDLWTRYGEVIDDAGGKVDRLGVSPGSENIALGAAVASIAASHDDDILERLVTYAERQLDGRDPLGLGEWGSTVYAPPTLTYLLVAREVAPADARRVLDRLLRALVASYALGMVDGGRYVALPGDRCTASSADGSALAEWLMWAITGRRMRTSQQPHGWDSRVLMFGDIKPPYRDLDDRLGAGSPDALVGYLAGARMRSTVTILRDARGDLCSWADRLYGSGSTPGRVAASWIGGELHVPVLHPPGARGGPGKSLGTQEAVRSPERGTIHATANGVRGWGIKRWEPLYEEVGVRLEVDGTVSVLQVIPGIPDRDVTLRVVGDRDGWRIAEGGEDALPAPSPDRPQTPSPPSGGDGLTAVDLMARMLDAAAVGPVRLADVEEALSGGQPVDLTVQIPPADPRQRARWDAFLSRLGGGL